MSRSVFLSLLEQWKCSKSNIKEELSKFFRDEKIKVISSCFDWEDYSGINRRLERLGETLRTRGFLHLKETLLDSFISVRSLGHSSGLVVGLLGRDGVGKSTFISEINTVLSACFPNNISFKKHPRFIYKAPILNKNEGYHFSKPHQYQARGTFGSFLKLNVLLLDFLFGYWFKVFPRKRRAFMILYDRYFADVLADPLRYRVNGNKWFARAVHYLLPKPDIWIILDIPSDVLLKRKQELTYEMSEQLRQKYLGLKGMLRNCMVINNDEEIEKTVSVALSFIISFLNRRFQTQS